MKINKLSTIYFSPTNTTKEVVLEISNNLNISKRRDLDLNKAELRENFNLNITKDELLIIGVPVYEERIPQILEEPLKKLKGAGQPVVLIALYGNIGAGIALKQLQSLMTKARFNVIAAASFIGEHSFSTEEFPIALGRPDQKDLERAKLFANKISKKMKERTTSSKNKKLQINGTLPLIAKILPRDSAKKFAKKPQLDPKKCDACNICFHLCPVEAISKDNLEINDNLCLRCFACVKKCPQQARRIRFKKEVFVKLFLKHKSKERQEPQFYI